MLEITAEDLLRFPEFKRNKLQSMRNAMSEIRKHFGLHRKQYPNEYQLAEYYKRYCFTPEYVRKYMG